MSPAIEKISGKKNFVVDFEHVKTIIPDSWPILNLIFASISLQTYNEL